MILKERREGGRGIRRRSTGGLGTVIFECFYDSDRRKLSTTAVWKRRCIGNGVGSLGLVAGFGVVTEGEEKKGGGSALFPSMVAV